MHPFACATHGLIESRGARSARLVGDTWIERVKAVLYR